MSHAPQSGPSPQDLVHATLNTTIHSLSLNRGSVPTTPVNTPISPSLNPPPNPQTLPPRDISPVSNPPIDMPNSQGGQTNGTIRWTWVNEAGPFMTNGELREISESSSATVSESETVVMFNLDRLNENRPDWLLGDAWERGQIPESSEGLIDNLGSRLVRDKLRFEAGSPSNGSNLNESNVMAQDQNLNQFSHNPQVDVTQAQTVSLDTGLEALRATEVAESEHSVSFFSSVRSDPGVLNCSLCDQGEDNRCGPSRKRIGAELGRFGRNIRQRLICGCFNKEGITHPYFINQSCPISCHYMHVEVSLCNPKGCWEADPKQLP